MKKYLRYLPHACIILGVVVLIFGCTHQKVWSDREVVRPDGTVERSSRGASGNTLDPTGVEVATTFLSRLFSDPFSALGWVGVAGGGLWLTISKVVGAIKSKNQTALADLERERKQREVESAWYDGVLAGRGGVSAPNAKGVP